MNIVPTNNPTIDVTFKDGSTFTSTLANKANIERVHGRKIESIQVIEGDECPAPNTAEEARISVIQKVLADNKPQETAIEEIAGNYKGLAAMQNKLISLGMTKDEIKAQGLTKKVDLAKKIYELTK